MTTNLLTAQNLTYAIGENVLLDDVSFSINEHRIVGLIGPNGAGKTTLLKCLLGLLKPQRGTIHLKGKDLVDYTKRELAHTVSYVPQILDPRIPFTVIDFVKMSRYAHHTDKEENERIARDALDKVSMVEFIDRHLDSLSGGERQRVSIAAALAQHPSLLILDEPSAHLDPRQCDEVHATLTDITESNDLTILCVTHELNWVSSDFEYAYGMKNGELNCAGIPTEIITEPNLRDLFDVSFTLVNHPITGAPMVLPPRKRTRS